VTRFKHWTLRRLKWVLYIAFAGATGVLLHFVVAPATPSPAFANIVTMLGDADRYSHHLIVGYEHCIRRPWAPEG
jgi:hypothetical protein